MSAPTTVTLASPLSEVALLGVLIIGGLTGWGLFKAMFADRNDFRQSMAYSFTSGWISTRRGDLPKNIGGTFRFFLWLALTIAGTVLGGMLWTFLLAATR